MVNQSALTIAPILDDWDEIAGPILKSLALKIPETVVRLFGYIGLDRYEVVDEALAAVADLFRGLGGAAEAMIRSQNLAKTYFPPKQLAEFNEETKTRMGLSESKCRSWADVLDRIRRSLPTLWIAFGTGRLLITAGKSFLYGEQQGDESKWLDGPIWEGVPVDIRQAAVVAKKQVTCVTALRLVGICLSADGPPEESSASTEVSQPTGVNEMTVQFVDDLCGKLRGYLIELRADVAQQSPQFLLEQISQAKDVPPIAGIVCNTAHQMADRLATRAIDLLTMITDGGEIRRLLDALPQPVRSSASRATQRLLDLRAALAQIPEFDHESLVSAIESEALRVAQRRAELKPQEPPPPPKAIPPAPRLTVTLEPPQAVWDGMPYPLTPDGAVFLDELRKADGDWVSGAKLRMRADRVRGSLPPVLQNLIEASPGKGSRIPRGRLA